MLHPPFRSFVPNSVTQPCSFERKYSSLCRASQFNAFRHYRYHCTESTYKRVIEACLRQGEIVTATLLFVLLVRDWQARRTAQVVVMKTNNPSNLDATEPRYPVSRPQRDIVNEKIVGEMRWCHENPCR